MFAAAAILVVIQLLVSMFQLALVLGAPLGEYTLGGQHKGKLPKRLRFVSAVSLLINLSISGHYLAQTGLISPILSDSLNGIVNWALVGFTLLGLAMNSISKSKLERKMWVPVLLLSSICAVIVALG
jgi:hypothetical protein